MNDEQARELSELTDAVVEGLFVARNYLDFLRGWVEGIGQAPDHADAVAIAVNQVGHAHWDAMILAVTTLLDRDRKSTAVCALVRMSRRFGLEGADGHVAGLLDAIGRHQAVTENLGNLRNKRIAHRSLEGMKNEFHEDNRVRIDAVDALLDDLQDALARFCSHNALSIPVGAGTELIDAGRDAASRLLGIA